MTDNEYQQIQQIEEIRHHAESIVENLRVLTGSFNEEYHALKCKIARCRLTEQYLTQLPRPDEALQAIKSFTQRLHHIVETAKKEVL